MSGQHEGTTYIRQYRDHSEPTTVDIDIFLKDRGTDLAVQDPYYDGDERNFWLDVRADSLPRAGQFKRARFRITVEITPTQPDVVSEQGEDVSTLVGHIEHDSDHAFDLTDPATSKYHGILLWEGDHKPEWLTSGDWYITVEFEYDHEETLAASKKTPKQVDLRRGVLDRTTPGVRERWASADRRVHSVTPDPDSERVYVKTSNGTIAMATDTGEANWHADDLLGKLTVSGDRLYAAGDGTVAAADAATGDVFWTCEIGGTAKRPPTVADLPTTDDDSSERVSRILYVPSSDGHMYAIDGSGELRWSHDTGTKVTSPCVVMGDIVCAGNWDDTVYAFDARTGDIEWTHQVTGGVLPLVSVDDGTVCAACYDGAIHTLSWSTGDEQWTFEPEGKKRWLGVDGGTVYVGTPKELVALDAATGEIHRQYDRDGWHLSVVNGTLYSHDGGEFVFVWALDADTGCPRWQYEANWVRDLTVGEDTVYAVGKGAIAALEPTGSTQVSFFGVLERFGGSDDSLARIGAVGDPEGPSLVYPRRYLPYYGDFLDARFDVVVGVDTDYQKVTGERQRESRQITEFTAEVTDREGGRATLSLTELDGDIDGGRLQVPADRLPEDLRDVGDSGYVSVYLEVDEDATPEEAKPDEWY